MDDCKNSVAGSALSSSTTTQQGPCGVQGGTLAWGSGKTQRGWTGLPPLVNALICTDKESSQERTGGAGLQIPALPARTSTDVTSSVEASVSSP